VTWTLRSLLAASALLFASLAPLSGCTSTDEAKAPAPAPAKVDLVVTYYQSMRADLTVGKVRVVNDFMRLDEKEAKAFWPIYQEYEEELFALGDGRMALMSEFVRLNAQGKLDDAALARLGPGWFDGEEKRLALLKAYHDRIAKEISPLRAAQFAQIEHRFATVVDLMIAADMPLLGKGR